MLFKKRKKKRLPAKIRRIQAAADICINSEPEPYFQDEFFDIFTNGKWDASGVTYTYIQLKPRRGYSDRITVYRRNNATNEYEYHPQTDFWEDHLFEVAETIKNRPVPAAPAPEPTIYDILPDDIRRKRLDSKKRVAAARARHRA